MRSGISVGGTQAKNTAAILLTALISFVVLAGCAPRQIVILMPDRDGQVGKASVVTRGGEQQLDKPGDMTSISTGADAPSPVTTADTSFIAAVFADAVAAEPLPPENFILFFKTGSTAMTAASKSAVPDIVGAIKKHGAVSIAIRGHTDTTGADAYNDALARSRADRIRDLLIHRGVSPDRMLVTSYGERIPWIPTADGVAEPRNRRVEVVVH